jgi:hypothetical protein
MKLYFSNLKYMYKFRVSYYAIFMNFMLKIIQNFLNKSNFVNIKDTFLAFFFLLIHLQFAIAIKL